MANEKKTFFINTELRAEIRKAEVLEGTFKNQKTGEDIVTRKISLSIDDMDDNRIFLTDRDMDRLELYERGTIGTFKLKIDFEEEFGIKARINVLDFVPDQPKKKA